MLELETLDLKQITEILGERPFAPKASFKAYLEIKGEIEAEKQEKAAEPQQSEEKSEEKKEENKDAQDQPNNPSS